MFCDSCKAQFRADMQTPWVLDKATMIAHRTIRGLTSSAAVEQTPEGRWRLVGPVTCDAAA